MVFKRCSIGTKRPKVCQENIPYTITPPPAAWTFETRQDGSMLSCSLCQILTLPSECHINRDSSDQATFFQSSIVQFWWPCANCSPCFLFLADRSGTRCGLNNNNNNLLHLYSAFLDTQSALHSKGTISSSTTNVQHPPGWCDCSHSAPEHPPQTSLLVERRQSDEANQCMGMIRRPWWSQASGLVWPGCRGNTPTLFRKTSWDF